MGFIWIYKLNIFLLVDFFRFETLDFWYLHLPATLLMHRKNVYRFSPTSNLIVLKNIEALG